MGRLGSCASINFYTGTTFHIFAKPSSPTLAIKSSYPLLGHHAIEFTSLTPCASSRRLMRVCFGGFLFAESGSSWNSHPLKTRLSRNAIQERLTSSAQTLILPSPPVEAIQPRDSRPPCIVPGFPVPHVTEYTVRSCSSNTSTHSHSCSVMRFQIRTVQSSDADAKYWPFGAQARDHTVDVCPVSVAKQNQSSVGSSR
jgi:hypothetical protein